MRSNTPVLMDLFDGYREAHGTYQITGEEDGKKIGKAFTLRKKVTVEKWEDHLDGKQGIGIIPITQHSTVKWGAIDIDDYAVNFEQVIDQVNKNELPLVPCRSKSGGLHLFLFLTEFTRAADVQAKLKEMAAAIGHGGVEIFPKQTEILTERGDIGQWINMPYFDEVHTQRFALDDSGHPLDLDGFIKLACLRRITPTDLSLLCTEPTEQLKGGPPCLQILTRSGFPNGTRNNGLFNLGVYAKKSNPDNWQKLLDDLNKSYMVPPLQSTEVQGVVKSLNRKDYTYSCKQPPIKDHCNQSKCRACKYGIGIGAGMPVMKTLSKLCTMPPTWFLDVEDGGRLELTTEELQSPVLFQRKCMELLNAMPPVLKREMWTDIVAKLMENVTMIETPADATPRGQLREHLETFCTGRTQARTPEEILLGKPWTYNKHHYFRLKDIISFLQRNNYKETAIHTVTKMLRDEGCVHAALTVRGRGVSLWKIKEFEEVGELKPPVIKNEEAY